MLYMGVYLVSAVGGCIPCVALHNVPTLVEDHHGGGEDVKNCKARCISAHHRGSFAFYFRYCRSCGRVLLDWRGMLWRLVWCLGKFAYDMILGSTVLIA